ncbi:transposase [Streptosporangium vulgare]|uniref:transposase n=1 Tax=Streptosporangium vulgare TaxID=46190 RepID=UPI003CD0AA14
MAWSSHIAGHRDVERHAHPKGVPVLLGRRSRRRAAQDLPDPPRPGHPGQDQEEQVLPWRDLPERFGSWVTVYKRHRRWSADGTWERLLAAVQAAEDAAGRVDWEVSVDSTTVRAHQHAAGAPHKAPAPVLAQRGR